MSVGNDRKYLITSYMKRWKMKEFSEMRITENETLAVVVAVPDWLRLCDFGTVTIRAQSVDAV